MLRCLWQRRVVAVCQHSYRQYPREFKEEAVALITDQGCSVQKAVDSLGIRSNILYRWQHEIEDQKSGKSLSEDEGTELKELRREVRELRMEKTVLKKASALFAKEMKSVQSNHYSLAIMR